MHAEGMSRKQAIESLEPTRDRVARFFYALNLQLLLDLELPQISKERTRLARQAITLSLQRADALVDAIRLCLRSFSCLSSRDGMKREDGDTACNCALDHLEG